MKVRGRPFKKGEPRPKNAGRKKGSQNRITREIKEFFIDLVNDPLVQDSIRAQVISGSKGSAPIFLGAAAHVLGKPKETVQLDTTPNMARLLQLAMQPPPPPSK